MNKKFFMTSVVALSSIVPIWANQQPTSNTNPAYDPSNVQAQLRLNIREDADTVHFIRDTNDPKIITKTYILKHADAYSIRPYLREMVQALKVDYNNTAGLDNSAYYNTYQKTLTTGDKVYVPTGVECIKYADGTNILIISAEDYRFADSKNGMGIDSLVEALDKENIANSSGQPKFIYFPANRPASELKEMITLVGANVSNDTSELIGGKDKVKIDEDMNCLFFNTATYSRKNIEEMLRLYDVTLPEVKISLTVYEIAKENDGTLGLDFQSWKNNNGAKFLSTGGNWGKNTNLANYNLGELVTNIARNGTVDTRYFNFEPKWNTKFLDFLVTKGKAKVVTTGELTVKNGETGELSKSTGTMYAAVTPQAVEATNADGTATTVERNVIDMKVANDAFKFAMNVTPSITEGATTLNVNVDTVSLLGFKSDGSARTSHFAIDQKVMLNNEKSEFFLGGIDKSEVVRDVVGIPLLKDLPILGWLFATERETTKRSQIVVVANCEIVTPTTLLDESDINEINIIKKSTDSKSNFNKYGYRQFLIDNDR